MINLLDDNKLTFRGFEMLLRKIITGGHSIIPIENNI